MVFTLHAAIPSLIVGITYDPLNMAGMEQGVSPKYHWVWPSNKQKEQHYE